VAALHELPALIRGDILFNSAVAFKELSSGHPILAPHYLRQAHELLTLSKESWCSWRAIKGDPSCPPIAAIRKTQNEIEAAVKNLPAQEVKSYDEKLQSLLKAKESESKSSIALREATAKLLDEERNFTASNAKEMLEKGLMRQQGAMLLAKMLPFLNPYKEPTSQLVTNFQEHVTKIEGPFLQALTKLQNELFTLFASCPQKGWEAVTEHFEAGLDLAKFAHTRLIKKALPYSAVIPLMQMAYNEWSKAKNKLQELLSEPQADTKKSPSIKRLKDLFEEDAQVPPIPRLIPQEGIIW
jgi:hypothetical protein